MSPIFTQKAEPAMCLTTFDPAPGVTDVLVGQADYKARVVSASGLLDSISSARPIRFAEVEVTTASGQIVACFETEADGSFGGDVPNDLGVLTVKVKSRSNNVDELQASVLNCPEENQPYSISGTYDPATPATVSVLADVTGDILGAPFNILDQFYEANSFLKTKIGNCGGDSAAECRAVEGAMPKITAYWAKGFNPNAYFNDPTTASYYLPGYYRLFILGGIGGDVASSDTDHFDNSIILHEYGHFLEDTASITDSPGGSHGGNKIIDPRLAWSEAFSNFIQAAITGVGYYQDTIGYTPGGTASNIFNVSLESSIGCTNGCDIPAVQGEGNFREFSISRLLWDIFDPTNAGDASGNDNVNDQFIDLWRAMTSTTGLKNPNEGFRSIALVHDYQESETASDWSTLRTNHKHNLTQDYGQYISTVGAGACTYTMDTFYDTTEEYTIKNHFASSSQYDAYTNQFDNSDMYYVDLSAQGGNTTITLDANTTSGNEVDLDLYAFRANESIASSSYGYYDNKTATPQTMSVTLAPGKYWLRVLAYTGRNNGSVIAGDTTIANGGWINAGGTMQYTLKIGATSLCVDTRTY